MARVAKIDNALKKRLERRETTRAINSRQKLVYFLIVCEGEKTEPNYFKALERELPRGTIELRIDGTGLNTLGVVDYAIRQRKIACRNFDRLWVVFDKDGFDSENFNSAILKAKQNGFGCAWSNEAFELWFLLHFQFINHSMSRTEYASFIEKEIRAKSKDNQYTYQKNSSDTYRLLQKFGNRMQAINWAKKLRSAFNDQRYATHNPATCVYELIEELLNPQLILEALDGEE
jgi:hypothetical protein